MSTNEDFSATKPERLSQGLVSGLALSLPSPFKNTAHVRPAPPPAIIVELVERFYVCWDTVPEFSLLGSERQRIGFALELYGNHDSSAEHPAETCFHCHNVFGSLREAEVHFPCQTHSFARQKPAGVRFGIRVVHRGTSDKIDEEIVTQWAKELEYRLSELGAVKRIAARRGGES